VTVYVADRLIITYVLLAAGAVMVILADAGLHSNTMYCDDEELRLTPVVLVSVVSTLTVCVPATAASTYVEMKLLTVSPQVPDNSPVAGRASPRREVYEVAISNP
jgi:hypothetical protein